RFAITASAASPLRRPRLKRSNGAEDTPGPSRVVTAAWTCGGAGQSGKTSFQSWGPGLEIGDRGFPKHRTAGGGAYRPINTGPDRVRPDPHAAPRSGPIDRRGA